MMPKEVITWLSDNEYGRVVSDQPVRGGCINNGTRLKTHLGGSFFLKYNDFAPKDMFAREVEGLRALNVPDGPRVPEPFIHGQHFLLMEDLKPSQRNKEYWGSLGRGLAIIHQHTYRLFGFEQNNFIGSTPQPNTWIEDGFDFFAEKRLLYQARLARKRGLLSSKVYTQIESISKKLPDLIPKQPASLLHGDLWSGNAISDEFGDPAIIDPAVHYGWVEAELAMTALFGGFPQEFYQAYESVNPLAPGWHTRFPIYNLYHLLNHLNIFGRSYLGQVMNRR
jgi:fructosamine-3-kinase